MTEISNINIQSINTLPTPKKIFSELPISLSQIQFVASSRKKIENILFGNDKKLLLIVGPCSIHDIEAGLDFAKRLKTVSSQVSDKIFIVMRAYFEKPRTSLGWKGLILDPHLDGSNDIPTGIRIARAFLSELISLKIPTATELLDPITPQYISDFICWTCIGARTTESQTHRQLASGLSMPLGFKNSTDGSIESSIQAIKAATSSQNFLGINEEGRASYINTLGNLHCHIVLRGSRSSTNFDQESISHTVELSKKNGIIPSIVVDCSHGNSSKNYLKQAEVFNSVLDQIVEGSPYIRGIMLESNIKGGNQALLKPKEKLEYGTSVTDACLDWDSTEELIVSAYEKLSPIISR